jgi:uncharacterized membrane protein
MIFALFIGLYFNVYVSISLLGIMFIDWLVQYLKLRESTNVRRFITGTLGGIGLINFYFIIYLFIANNII